MVANIIVFLFCFSTSRADLHTRISQHNQPYTCAHTDTAGKGDRVGETVGKETRRDPGGVVGTTRGHCLPALSYSLGSDRVDNKSRINTYIHTYIHIICTVQYIMYSGMLAVFVWGVSC